MVLSLDGRASARSSACPRAGLAGRAAALRRGSIGTTARSPMATFLTGSTGYLGSYLAAGLLTGHRERLNLLVRARSSQEARERLWQSLQLHLEFSEFIEYVNSRTRIFLGDLTSERFGLSDDEYHALVDTTDSIVHCAASLNRKSEKQCLNVNLRGSLEVIQLARRAQNRNGLRRYSHVSTVAVAGKRLDEVVTEDAAIDWARSDYDPYARTKKFCEQMVHQLLADVPRTIFRPAIDMLARMAVLPLRATDKIDIVPANYVSKAIVAIHQKDAPAHSTYHLSSGVASQTYGELTDALAAQGGWRRPAYWPSLGGVFSSSVNWLSNRSGSLGYSASLLKVFWPYLDWNTVFDNSRVVAELGGEKPAKFSDYALPLLEFCRKNRFRYPARPWPADAVTQGRLAAGSAHV